MKKLIRRVSAAVLSLAIVGGAMPYAPSLFKLPDFSLTANAASGYSYDSTTKVMTLKGDWSNTISSNAYSAILDNGVKKGATKIVADSTFKMPADSDYLFGGFSDLVEVDLSQADFSSVYTISQIFSGCTSLKTVKFGSNFNNVTSMRNAFNECSSLESIDWGGLNTSKVENMDGLFKNCENITAIDVSGFDTSSLETVYNMFYGCSSLLELDLSNFSIKSSCATKNMIRNCTNLYSLKLGSSNIKELLLEGCTALYMLEIGNYSADIRVSPMRSVEDLTNDREEGWMVSDDSKSTDISTQVVEYNYDTSSYETYESFTAQPNTLYLRRSVWTWSTESFIVNRFSQHMYLHGNVNLDDITGLTENQKQWVRYISAEDGTVFPSSCFDMFRDFTVLESVQLNNVDTSNVTSLGNLFRGCKRLKNVEISNWNTSKVKNLQYLFYNCERLESAEMIQNWDTSSVTHTPNLFYGCTNLKTFDGSKWKTNNLQSASSMFAKCTSLREVNITNWNTDNLVYANLMFNGCSSLTHLELGPDGSAGSSAPDAWRTPKVTTCNNMFQGCSSLESLRINNLSLGENVRSDQMFSGLDSLVILYFGKTFEVTENMNLPNEYGWTAVSKGGIKVSGDGKYAVIPKPARYEQFTSMKGYKFFDVAMPGVNNNYYYETIYLAGKPYPGNTVDNTIGSEGVHYSNYNYSIDEENTGWYDVDNGRFLENGEKFRFGGAYVFKIRYVPKANVSLTLPDMYNLSKINYFFVNKYGDLENYSLLKTAFANQNEDGSVDVYAVLRDKVNALNYPADLTSNEQSVLMDVPEDAVTVLATTNNQIKINRIPSLTISTWSDSIWENYIKVELSSLINDYYYFYMDYTEASSYEFSFDGGEYTKYTNGYNVYEDLASSSKHTLSIRLEGQEEPFYTEDIWTEVGDNINGIMNSASLTFGGTLGLNYYVTLDDIVKNDPDAYAEYTIGGVTKRQLVSDTTVDSKGRNKFTCPVYATQMNDNINFKLYNGNGKQYNIQSSKGTNLTESGFNYSVAAYCNAIISSSSNSKMVKLAKATLDYGISAQLYFNYNASGLAVSSDVTAVKASVFDQYKATVSGTKPTGVSKVTMTVVFDSDNTLRVYYKYDSGVDPYSYTYNINGKKATLKNNSNGYYVEVNNLAADKLSQTYQFTVKDKTTSYTVNASALSYARGLASNSNVNTQNLAKALYLYNQAAVAYVG